MKKIVDMEEWNKFYQGIVDDLNFNDASDYGYGHGIKKANDWLELNTEEEKRGRWGVKGTAYGCSICGEGSPAPIHRYCPNCGAKMDLGEEE